MKRKMATKAVGVLLTMAMMASALAGCGGAPKVISQGPPKSLPGSDKYRADTATKIISDLLCKSTYLERSSTVQLPPRWR